VTRRPCSSGDSPSFWCPGCPEKCPNFTENKPNQKGQLVWLHEELNPDKSTAIIIKKDTVFEFKVMLFIHDKLKLYAVKNKIKLNKKKQDAALNF